MHLFGAVNRYYQIKNANFKKFLKNNHQIWIMYDREIRFINFNFELKRKRQTRQMFFICIHVTWNNVVQKEFIGRRTD